MQKNKSDVLGHPACEWCGHDHPVEKSCWIEDAPLYFFITDFPRRFDWKNGTIERLVVPCGDSSEVDLMLEWVAWRKISGWATGPDKPRQGNISAEVIVGGCLTFIQRWAPGCLAAAYRWWDENN